MCGSAGKGADSKEVEDDDVVEEEHKKELVLISGHTTHEKVNTARRRVRVTDNLMLKIISKINTF
jgi:hypothetical protein